MKNKFPIILSICVLVAAFAIKREDFSIVQQLRLHVFDAFIVAHPREYTPQPVKIIDFDEESQRRIGQWPWPRTQLAKLVNRLTDMGAAAIAWDVLFAEADRTAPQNMLEVWGEQEGLGKALAKLPDHDEMFAESLAQTNTITSFVFLNAAHESQPESKAGFSFAGADPRRHLHAFPGATTTLPLLESVAKGNGALNSFPDKDGIIRRMPLAALIGDTFYPTLSAEALRVAQGASGYIIKSAGASGEEDFGAKTGITAVKIGEFEIPTDAEGAFWIYYTREVPERYIPAWKMLEEDFDPSLVEGNILLMGTSAVGLKDIRATPMSQSTNGVEVHAQAIEQVLAGEFLMRPDWVSGTEDMLMLAVGIVLIVMMAKLSAVWGAVFTLLALSAAGYASWRAFLDYQLLIDPITPSIAIIFLYLSGSLSRYIAAEREKKYIKQAFSQYMSPDLVAQLSANPEKLQLGGEMKELTILFCDIRGFTSISETMDAHELTVFINHFLTPMTDVIMARQGTIDKYMGDCIMAFWNAPLDDAQHAQHGVDAALAMLAALEEVNKTSKHPIQIGIGLNTGICCVGNMGSDQRFDYSVLGDDVNLASRLEGQSKTYGVPVLVGQGTAEKLGDAYATLELDAIRVKGKKQAVKVYALLGDAAVAGHPAYRSFRDAFMAMLASYRAQNWAEASKKLKVCKASAEKLGIELSVLFALYAARIAECKASPPAKDWDGVYEAVSK